MVGLFKRRYGADWAASLEAYDQWTEVHQINVTEPFGTVLVGIGFADYTAAARMARRRDGGPFVRGDAGWRRPPGDCVRRRRGAVGGGVPAGGLRVRPRCAILTYVLRVTHAPGLMPPASAQLLRQAGRPQQRGAAGAIICARRWLGGSMWGRALRHRRRRVRRHHARAGVGVRATHAASWARIGVAAQSDAWTRRRMVAPPAAAMSARTGG